MGELITRWTIRLALLLCTLAVAGSLWSLRGAVSPTTRQALAGKSRLLWTLAFLVYLLHVAVAFHFYHHWSHTEAWNHTAERTDEVLAIHWGGGIWFNYFFTLAWGADVVWSWWRANSHQSRPRWLKSIWGAWFALIVFFATVVFESGATRWTAAGVLMGIAALALWCWNSRGSRHTDDSI